MTRAPPTAEEREEPKQPKQPKQPLGERIERSIEDRTDAEEIERSSSRPIDVARIRKTAIWVAITGVSLYLVAPSLLEVLSSWQRLREIDPLWYPLLLLFELASLVCLWWLQKLALPVAPISGIVDSQLAGNALSKIAPGGGAVGAALQYKMLVERGVSRGPAVTAITAVNLLVFAVVLALPLLALPILITGSVDESLLRGALISIVVFVALAALGVAFFAIDGPLDAVGRAVQGLRNRLRRKSEKLTTLPARLERERDRLLTALGPNWKRALLASVLRWATDYAVLFAALAAVGSHPQPGLVLLAFCTAQVLAQIPVTPGGLGFVEAGLTATLALAGVAPGDAVLATFAYRLFTYWLPLPLGLLGLALHRRHLTGPKTADR